MYAPLQEFAVRTGVLKKNRKKEGDKLKPRWIGPYSIYRSKGKGVYILSNTKTAQ